MVPGVLCLQEGSTCGSWAALESGRAGGSREGGEGGSKGG